ncbi:hypothetical protein E1165_12325 [Micromonospora sp. KC723]|nr:hypothetical protein E1165_12325 [Micromonospora sp. KC723]
MRPSACHNTIRARVPTAAVDTSELVISARSSALWSAVKSTLTANHFALATVRAGIILHLLPVFGVLSAVAVLGERIGGWQWCGAALIVASIFVFPDGEPED